MSKNGTLFGVSLGPGDPGLITRRAWALLERPDAIWTYPVRSTRSDSYALDIAQRAGLPLPTQHLPLLFPMTHDAEKLARHWLKAAETVRDLLATGQDVLFLVEGDASTYASFSYLARVLRELDPAAQVQVVAGVSSFNAVCATVQVPLSEQDDTIAIVPAAYGIHAVEKMLDDFDTLVLMKVKPLLDELIDLLERRGLLAHSCLVEKAGSPLERVVRDVASLKGTQVNYLSLLLVKNPGREKGPMVRGCRKKTSAELAEEAVE
ncbi:precorrin-2 C(20)-methyltransferase [Rhodoferax fermentans]|uniref:Precorrin-2 C(20)-methyltransferase n=1 Tax=Rhodoferax fermentans TaxID=28066 RepID=A0A1T1ATD9_RHOFE|nr:precorrin-2 C(20)-methyltransferase [Rhodoferax fermentans]MBK1685102.1 precorrin-2 C(20)-methyltransferase [Rhodoferax fermentans]OOV07351.1 precorrin-2 C(20)-methyltransferase [Rhodoferax fermentans]